MAGAGISAVIPAWVSGAGEVVDLVPVRLQAQARALRQARDAVLVDDVGGGVGLLEQHRAEEL